MFNYKTKIFCLSIKVFSYMAYVCVRELGRARDIGMTCEHSCRNIYVIGQCFCKC